MFVMTRFFLFLILFCGLGAVLFCACGRAAAPARPVSRDCAIPWENGKTIAATLISPPSGGPNPAGVLLIHGEGNHHAIWNDFAERLAAEGFTALIPELPKDFEAANAKTLFDLLLKTLVQSGADPRNLALAAETDAASLALEYAVEQPAVQAVIMISPGLDYRGIDAESLIAAHKELPVLLLTSENDAYSAAAASTLKSAAMGFCELRAYPGSTRGADLLSVSPNAADQSLQWLREILMAPQAAPAP